jgi:hypothetical protein
MRKLILVLLTLLFMAASCTSAFKSESRSMADRSSPSARDASSGETPDSYYDFEDILVPKEMKLVPKSSLLFETPQIKAGVILFEGRVEPVSLFDYFMANMPKDNWQLRSYFKYGRYIMVFEKNDKDCIISINEKAINTELEIWVTPRMAKK